MNITITRFPYESDLGGLETVVLHLAKGLRKKGHTVSFIGTCSTLLSLFEKNNFLTRIVTVPRSPVSKASIIWFLLLSPFILFQFSKIIWKMKPGDVIYMLSLGEKLFMTKMASKKGVKVVWGEHEALMSEDGTFRPWLRKNPFLKLYQKNSKYAQVITVSNQLRKQFEELGNIKNLDVIPNGINTDFFSPSYLKRYTPNSKIQIPDSSFIIGTIARLKPEKGMMEFLKVATVVKKRIKNVHFVVCGDGTLRQKMEGYMKKDNLEKDITFLGHLPHESIRDVLNMFEIALFLSKRWETFGLTPLEAMAMKKPTIFTKHFGFYSKDIEKDTLTADPYNIEETANLIQELYENQVKRKQEGEKGYKLIKKHFSLEKMVHKYETLFEK